VQRLGRAGVSFSLSEAALPTAMFAAKTSNTMDPRCDRTSTCRAQRFVRRSKEWAERRRRL